MDAAAEDTERREAVWRSCERFLSFAPARVADVLTRLAGRASDRDSDRYGQGDHVRQFEQRVASLVGHEEAVFLPSGTMAQQIALRVWADRRGTTTVAFHPLCHLEAHEEQGYAHLHRLHARLLGHRDRLIELTDLEEIAEPVAALLLELPQRDLGGRLPEWDDLLAQTEWARQRGVALHLDGARLWQCGPYYGRPTEEVGGLFDSVYVSFYKDLGGIAGCALAGPPEVVAEARVWQVRHGGRLAGLDPLVLSAEAGLDERLPRMGTYYEKALDLARALGEHPGVEVAPDPPQTPMMHLFLRGDPARLTEAALALAEERRVWLFGRLAPSPLPGFQRLELTVTEATLELPTEEIAALFAELFERAASA